MSNLEFFAKMLPNGASTIITGINAKTKKEVFFVVANKKGETYIKEVSSKEEGRTYITELFGGESKFCGKFIK